MLLVFIFFFSPFHRKNRFSNKRSNTELPSEFKMDANRNRTTHVKGAAFHKQAKDNLQSILANFIEIIELIKVEETQQTQIREQLPRLLTNTTDDFEMRVRAQKMVRLAFARPADSNACAYRFVLLNPCSNSCRISKIKRCCTTFGQSMTPSKLNGSDSKINSRISTPN